jgi:hypothetical protein
MFQLALTKFTNGVSDENIIFDTALVCKKMLCHKSHKKPLTDRDINICCAIVTLPKEPRQVVPLMMSPLEILASYNVVSFARVN